MIRFTMDNTQGFTQAQLDAMNAEFEARTNGLDQTDLHEGSAADRIAEEICDKFA